MNVRSLTGLAACIIGASLALSGGSRLAADDVLINFGGGTTTDSLGRTWVNVLGANDISGSPFTLTNTQNIDSGYRLTISNPPGVTSPIGFNATNSDGTTSPTGMALALGYPVTATTNSLYGNTVAFDQGTVQAVRLTLSNLQPDELYDLTFFASRMNATDNRETEYRVTSGSGTTSLFLNVANNTGNVVGLVDLLADVNGEITIEIDPGPNNNNANRFFYLGVMELNSSPAPVAAVPEPATAAIWLLLAGGIGVGIVARRRNCRRGAASQ